MTELDAHASVEAVAGRRRRNESAPRRRKVGPLKLNDEEYAALTLAAEKAGLSRGAYATAAAVAVARGDLVPLPADDRDRLRALMDARAQLRKVGGNLNQVAVKLNTDQDAPELAAVLRLVERAVLRIDENVAVLLGRDRAR
ncbi:MAG: plasmid mobilization protein [Mycobacterium sp.]